MERVLYSTAISQVAGTRQQQQTFRIDGARSNFELGGRYTCDMQYVNATAACW